MKTSDVPQDNNPILQGYSRKAVYAVNDQGKYEPVATSGWDVEEVVLRDVLEDFEAGARDARVRIREGKVSPIEYFMHKNYMDLPGLSGGVGLGQWRVRRHMKPGIFAKLNSALVKRYADFFKTSVENLRTLCDEPL